MSKYGIGQPVLRFEDPRLLRGQGRYINDVNLHGQAYAVFVRSPHAHANIRSIDVEEAKKAPGVLAVYTGHDVVADGLGMPKANMPRKRPDGKPMYAPQRPPLITDRVRYVGDPVAMVIADTLAEAKDAAELVNVDYEPLPSVTSTADTVKPGAPAVWDDCPDNISNFVERGNKAATDEAIKGAAKVIKRRYVITRVHAQYMEPRGTLGTYDPGEDRMTLYADVQYPHRVRNMLAQNVFKVPESKMRVIAGDVGGGFGTKGWQYIEHRLTLWAARKLLRPVKWTCERSESFLSDYQGRDLRVEAELALDADGTFLAVRSSHLSNLGAYAATFVPLQKGMGILSAVYHIPVAFVRGRGAFTNTAPTAPYRSAGRPEVIFVIERLIDLAADRLALDPVALRQRNLIPSAAQPYTNPLGLTYDSGDYEQVMERALALADWQGFPARRAEVRRRGRWRGIGIANFVEITTGAPRERAEITVLPDGKVELVMGTMSSGQGHETSFAQLVTEWLGVPFESINYVAHDTARVSAGGGSNSGRSMKLAATIIGKATDQIIDKGRKIAGILLEAAEADLDFAAGRFRVTGTDREISLFDIAAAAIKHRGLPEELRGPLVGISDETLRIASFPFGTQICEVEVDVETGAVEIVRFVAVDDVGRAVNPMILHGQTHGGIAQGVGQALLEDTHYDPASGQLLTASFMDYAMPRADNLPWLETELSEIPSPTNRLGVRSAGEGGTTPALAAVINAVVDALAELGVSHIELPATPERVWRAIQAAGQGR